MRISDWSSDVCSSDLAFAAFVALLSASTLAYALVRHPLPWGALRLIDGICVAGVFVCLESWLGDRAEAGTRGTILASYMVALYSGQAIGQLLLRSGGGVAPHVRSEEHTSELQSLMRISYAVFCLKKKTTTEEHQHITT